MASLIDGLADEHGARVDDVGDAREERGRRAVVDRDERSTAVQQAAPERDDPLGAVLGPDGDRVAASDALRCRAAPRTRARPRATSA